MERGKKICKINKRGQRRGKSELSNHFFWLNKSKKRGEREREGGREGKEERRNRVERNALYMPGSFHADKTDLLFSDSCTGALCPR